METTSHNHLYQTKNIEIDFKFKTVDEGNKRSWELKKQSDQTNIQFNSL